MVVIAIVASGCGASVSPSTNPIATTVADTASPAGPSASAPDRPFRPTPAPSPTFAAYIVQQGDTLLALAVRFGTTARSLAYWNRARYPSLDPDSVAYAPDRIEIGWTLAYLPGQVVDPDNPPSAAATAPGPEGSAEPFPTPPADGSALIVAHGPRGSHAVALAFDYAGGPGAGAPTAGGADAVLQLLVATGITATVFVAPAAADPSDVAGRAVLARLATARPGVTAGLLLPGPDAGTAGTAALSVADARLAPLLGRSTAPWLRITVPVGAAALGAIGRAGWTWLIGADVDPGDGILPADGGPIAADIAARVISRATGGSIIRLTLGGTHTREALPAIIDGLGGKGLHVVSLAELLGLSGP
jgi:hypothetical protein